MKKSLIATGAAAVALAAMPALGAFADVIDTVEITIAESCTVASDTASTPGAENTMTADMVNNDVKEFTGTTGAMKGGDIYVTCNSASGWKVTAQGYSGNTAGTTDMVPDNASNTPIATAAEASIVAGTSAWGFKVTDDTTNPTGASITTSAYTAVPETATKVASKAGAISQGILHTNYKVSTSATQQADTYTGKVKYVVSQGTN